MGVLEAAVAAGSTGGGVDAAGAEGLGVPGPGIPPEGVGAGVRVGVAPTAGAGADGGVPPGKEASGAVPDDSGSRDCESSMRANLENGERSRKSSGTATTALKDREEVGGGNRARRPGLPVPLRAPRASRCGGLRFARGVARRPQKSNWSMLSFRNRNGSPSRMLSPSMTNLPREPAASSVSPGLRVPSARAFAACTVR